MRASCSERDLLQRWRDLLLDTDPDVIIGYNIINFDLPYLFDRGKVRRGVAAAPRPLALWGLLLCRGCAAPPPHEALPCCTRALENPSRGAACVCLPACPSQALGIDNLFNFWGRLRGSKTRMRDTQFSSKAYGTHEYKEISIEGRVQFDLLVAIQREHKLASYRCGLTCCAPSRGTTSGRFR